MTNFHFVNNDLLRKKFFIYNKDTFTFFNIQHFDKDIAYLKKVVYDNNNLFLPFCMYRIFIITKYDNNVITIFDNDKYMFLYHAASKEGKPAFRIVASSSYRNNQICTATPQPWKSCILFS